MSVRSAPELEIELGTPDELFYPRESDVEAGRTLLDAGVDQIRAELSARSLRQPLSLVIVLPQAKATPEVEQGIREAITRYCDAGIAREQTLLTAIRREGWRALMSGAILLAVGLALSEAVLRSGLPKEIRSFLGDGLFVVAAWVGMWYPLDTLIYTGRPHHLERRVLRALREMEIVVRPACDRPAGDGWCPDSEVG